MTRIVASVDFGPEQLVVSEFLLRSPVRARSAWRSVPSASTPSTGRSTAGLDVVGNPGRVVSLAAHQRRDDGILLIGGGGDPGTEIRDAARPEVARLLATGELTLPIQATYSLGDTAEAHSVGLTGHTRGKLVIVP
jgi:NADPH:quinone reductase-like Zn-dependent oxidoreductase